MPIEAVAGESATPEGGTEIDYSDVGQGAFDDDSNFALPADFEQDIPEPVEPPPAPGQLPAQPSGTQAAPPQQQQPQQQQVPQPQQPAADGVQPVQQQPVQQPAESNRIFSPGELAQQLGRNRDAMIDALAAQKFQLSPTEVQALEVDAVGVLPKIMARVYFEATVNGLQQLANMVPRMVEHVANERIAESEAESDFHREWPNIDRNNPEHMRTVVQLSTSFRQMNPRASMADAIKYVGMAATNFLGLPMPVRGGNNSARPAAPARRTVNPPFAPANGGRAQPPAGTPIAPSGDPFAGLGQNFDE